jgi:hypothetical protein
MTKTRLRSFVLALFAVVALGVAGGLAMSFVFPKKDVGPAASLTHLPHPRTIDLHLEPGGAQLKRSKHTG